LLCFACGLDKVALHYPRKVSGDEPIKWAKSSSMSMSLSHTYNPFRKDGSICDMVCIFARENSSS
jgi:hypothetical protein